MARTDIALGTGSNTFGWSNIVATEVEVTATGTVLDDTLWGETHTGVVAGAFTRYEATFKGYITGQPADPGGDTITFVADYGGTTLTWTRNDNDDGAFIDSWTLDMNCETGIVSISGHITCNGAPAFSA